MIQNIILKIAHALGKKLWFQVLFLTLPLFIVSTRNSSKRESHLAFLVLSFGFGVPGCAGLCWAVLCE